MSATPAKRVTRSRAAAGKTAEEMNAPPKRIATSKSATSRRTKAIEEDLTQVEKISEPTKPVKSSTSAPIAAPTLPTTRRRIKVTPLDAPVVEEKAATEAPAEHPATKKSKTASKSKKARKTADEETEEHAELNGAELPAKPKTRAKAATVKEKAEEKQSATKTRGRPKKVATAEMTEQPQSQEPVRQTRTRAGSGAAGTQATAASIAKAAVPARKRVTFQDLPESDKENQPVNAKKQTSKAQRAPAVGLRAKPIRKPATASTRRSAKTADKMNTAEPKPAPLSPKKITQVAKSASPNSSDEDELSGAKTPVRDLSQSPKRIANLAGPLLPVKKLDFGAALVPKSSEKTALSSSLMSPARRPPASPFKDALKDSPKRGEGTLIFPASSQASIATVMAAPTSQSQSTLLQSPKRGAFDSSIFTQSTTKKLKSPTKATLLQSPAKRLFTPAKLRTVTATTPGNAGFAQTPVNGASVEQDTAVSCHFRACQSAERSVKVHRMSDEELAIEARANVDFDESILDIRSPIKLSKPSYALPESTYEEDQPLSIIHNDLDGADATPREPAQVHSEGDETAFEEAGEPMEDILLSGAAELAQPEQVSQKKGISPPKATFLFRAAHHVDDEAESSEDELQADTTSISTPGFHMKNAKSRLSTINPADTSKNLGFTPLATQLSSWLASSPDKSLKTITPSRGSFSPLAAQHVPGKVQISRQFTPQRQSVGSRKAMSAAGSAVRLNATPTRFSDLVMTGTPENPSYFADEMVVKDLEDEAETLQDNEHEEHNMLPEFVEDIAGVPAAEDVTQGVSNDAAAVDMMDVTAVDEFGQEVQTQLHDILPTAEEVQIETLRNIAADGAVFTDIVEAAPGTVDEAPVSGERAITQEELSTQEELEISTENVQPALEEIFQATGIPVASPNVSQHQDSALATPVRQTPQLSRFANTVVSKVPLRPEGCISPIKVPRKRSRSLSAGPALAKQPVVAPTFIPRSNTVISLSPERRVRTAASPAPSQAPETPGQQSFMIDDFGDSTLDGIEIDEDDENLPPPTPFSVNVRSTVATPTKSVSTPARSPLKAVGNGVLLGAVVFVDVHTTEGADASGIFVELLTQMGAKCVRSWTWNPRASTVGGEEEAENTPAGKVGITHVVYKDGGKRILEKVRDAEGVVRCVGVGWVLE